MSSVWNVSLKRSTVVYHHCNAPFFLVSSFHIFDVLVESFTMLFTHSSQIFGEVIKMGMEEMHFQAHQATNSLKCFQHSSDDLFFVRIFYIIYIYIFKKIYIYIYLLYIIDTENKGIWYTQLVARPACTRLSNPRKLANRGLHI